MSMWKCNYCENWLDFGSRHECEKLKAARKNGYDIDESQPGVANMVVRV